MDGNGIIRILSENYLEEKHMNHTLFFKVTSPPRVPLLRDAGSIMESCLAGRVGESKLDIYRASAEVSISHFTYLLYLSINIYCSS